MIPSTPEEKAKEVFNKVYKKFSYNPEYKEKAKSNAINAVDQISVYANVLGESYVDFYQKVKQEIEKL